VLTDIKHQATKEELTMGEPFLHYMLSQGANHSFLENIMKLNISKWKNRMEMKTEEECTTMLLSLIVDLHP
jgi:hypothetical protein